MICISLKGRGCTQTTRQLCWCNHLYQCVTEKVQKDEKHLWSFCKGLDLHSDHINWKKKDALIVTSTLCYLKNHWTKHSLICSYFDAFDADFKYTIRLNLIRSQVNITFTRFLSNFTIESYVTILNSFMTCSCQIWLKCSQIRHKSSQFIWLEKSGWIFD